MLWVLEIYQRLKQYLWNISLTSEEALSELQPQTSTECLLYSTRDPIFIGCLDQEANARPRSKSSRPDFLYWPGGLDPQISASACLSAPPS